MNLAEARAAVERNPTPAQIESGNYRKGHVSVQGLNVAIETPKGGIRRSKPGAAKPWQVRMRADYGYVKRTLGADGDHVDVFLGPDLDAPLVFVQNQIDGSGYFDEHKAMIGYATLPEAHAAYMVHYPADHYVGPWTTLTMPEFKAWLSRGKTDRPLPEWHRPCLWAGPEDGPSRAGEKQEPLVAKAEGEIKGNPKNRLGTDKRGRMHWVSEQLELFRTVKRKKAGTEIRPDTTTILPIADYDKVIVSFSGGKDSIAMVLHLLELGVPREKIELWHQLVDGAPGSPTLMDWPVTEKYVAAFAKAMGLPIRFQWRKGGFQGELTRYHGPSAEIEWETGVAGETGHNKNTGPRSIKGWRRARWPMKSPDLIMRWCSSYLKMAVASSALSHDDRFEKGAKILYLTGERREEGGGRKYYAGAQAHGATTKTRRVDQWRPVLEWSEAQVWDIMKRWNIQPHPAYRLGWGRLSCMSCIYGKADQWATILDIAPTYFHRLEQMERTMKEFWQREAGEGKTPVFSGTIDMEGRPLREVASLGKSWVTDETRDLAKLALGTKYDPDDIFVRGGQWKHPAGAFKNTDGPT